jgi:hypothetical protein
MQQGYQRRQQQSTVSGNTPLLRRKIALALGVSADTLLGIQQELEKGG